MSFTLFLSQKRSVIKLIFFFSKTNGKNIHMCIQILQIFQRIFFKMNIICNCATALNAQTSQIKYLSWFWQVVWRCWWVKRALHTSLFRSDTKVQNLELIREHTACKIRLRKSVKTNRSKWQSQTVLSREREIFKKLISHLNDNLLLYFTFKQPSLLLFRTNFKHQNLCNTTNEKPKSCSK